MVILPYFTYLMNDDSEGEHVDTLIIRLVEKYLWSHVTICPRNRKTYSLKIVTLAMELMTETKDSLMEVQYYELRKTCMTFIKHRAVKTYRIRSLQSLHIASMPQRHPEAYQVQNRRP